MNYAKYLDKEIVEASHQIEKANRNAQWWDGYRGGIQAAKFEYANRAPSGDEVAAVGDAADMVISMLRGLALMPSEAERIVQEARRRTLVKGEYAADALNDKRVAAAKAAESAALADDEGEGNGD